MAATYTLDVVTPERIMLSEPVTQTLAPGPKGSSASWRTMRH